MTAARRIRAMLATKSNRTNFCEHFDVLPTVDSFQMDVAQDLLISIDVLRLDKIHPFVSGNKWFKLKHHLLEALESGKSEVLTFGGMHSNHLHAVAYTGFELGMKTIGLIRGHPDQALTPTLQDCQKWGMELHWLDRQEYRKLSVQGAQDDVLQSFPNAWVIPEGGAGRSGTLGVESLFNSLYHAGKIDHDIIVTAVGSGATLAGIAQARVGRAHCLGFSALKDAHDLEQRVERQLLGSSKINPWRICSLYHFGGFAKINKRLTDFISHIYDRNKLLLDPIYTGKAMFGLSEYIHQGRIPAGSKVLMVHTGGLQGWRGFGDCYKHLYDAHSVD